MSTPKHGMMSIIDFEGMNLDNIKEDWLEQVGMDWRELVTALNFFLDENNIEGVMLQCLSVFSIPYIKRTIMELLGVPDRFINNTLYYEGKRIVLVSIKQGPTALEGYGDIPAFYLSSNKPEETEELRRSVIDIRFPWSILDIWEEIGLSPVAMIKALMDDGYSTQQAVSVVSSHFDYFVSWRLSQ